MAERALKPGWRWVKFGEVVRQVKDKVDPDTSGLERFVAGEHMDTDRAQRRLDDWASTRRVCADRVAHRWDQWGGPASVRSQSTVKGAATSSPM